MKIYYYAKYVYQFSHALPLYEKVKGVFVVKDVLTYLRFKKFLRFKAVHGEKTFLDTPEIIICPLEKLKDLPGGILVFFANDILVQQDYSNLKTVFYEHGSSDKKYSGGKTEGVEKIRKYDYIFLWGPKNRQKILDLNIVIPEEKLLEVGGFRFDKYLDSEKLKKEQIKRLKIKNINLKNILYAPTWRFGKGTLMKYGKYFASEIIIKNNLIIRPHSHDRNYGQMIYFLSKLKGIKNIYFSQPANIVKRDIIYDFAVSDMLIGVVSSVVYEYLITQKPILLANNQYENRHDMSDMLNLWTHVDKFKAGMDINMKIKKTLETEYSEFFDKMLHHCFYSKMKVLQTKLYNLLKNYQNINNPDYSGINKTNKAPHYA